MKKLFFIPIIILITLLFISGCSMPIIGPTNEIVGYLPWGLGVAFFILLLIIILIIIKYFAKRK
jgi:hypothetical protein